MNVYDFDNTIYGGESPVDFFIFCMLKNKKLLLYLPLIIYMLILYKLNILSEEKLHKLSNKLSTIIIKNKENANDLISEFWKKNSYKLKKYFLDTIKEEDVIITASPKILIDGIADKLNTKNIICSELNLDTGIFEFICYRKNKVKAFKEKYPTGVINAIYTDSLNDISLMELADKSYIVKKDRVIRKYFFNYLIVVLSGVTLVIMS